MERTEIIKYPPTGNFPVDFQGADPNGHHAVYFVKDEDAGSSKYRTHLFFRNHSGRALKIKPRKVSDNNPHFLLRFRPGLINGRMVRKMLPLVNELENQMGATGWKWHDLHTRSSDGVIFVRLTYTGEKAFEWGGESTLNLQLRPIHDAPLSGAFFLKLELEYSGILTDNPDVESSDITHRVLNLAAIDLSGKTFFPVKAIIQGSNTILNDRSSLNSRTISLWNTLSHSSVPIRGHTIDHESGTMITLAIRCHDDQDIEGMKNHPTVLGTKSEVGAINLEVTPHLAMPPNGHEAPNWLVTQHADVPGWISWEINLPYGEGEPDTFLLNHDMPKDPDKTILSQLSIHMDKIISSAPDGISNVYMHFHHVPGYADHTLIVQLEKTPLILRGQSVGIGIVPNEEAKANLHVKGNSFLTDLKVEPLKDSQGRVISGNGTLSVVGKATLNGDLQVDQKATVKGELQVAKKATLNGELQVDQRATVKNLTVNESATIKNLTITGTINYHDMMPVGSIIAYGGSSPPSGWILCDGEEIKHEKQPVFNGKDLGVNLRKVLGKDSTPDLRSRFIVGAGKGDGLSNYPLGLGENKGAEIHTLTIQQIPSHSHSGSTKDAGEHTHGLGTRDDYDEDMGTDLTGVNGPGSSKYTSSAGKHSHAFTTSSEGGNDKGNTESHNNLPPYYALIYIIKF